MIVFNLKNDYHLNDYICYCRNANEISKEHHERIDVVVKSINEIGTYELKENELNFGASTAWRNASRCIGRMQWSKLKVK